MQHYVFSYCPAPRRLLMRLYTTTPNNVLRSNGEKRKWSSMLRMFYVRECSQENIVRITISSRIHFSNSIREDCCFPFVDVQRWDQVADAGKHWITERRENVIRSTASHNTWLRPFWRRLAACSGCLNYRRVFWPGWPSLSLPTSLNIILWRGLSTINIYRPSLNWLAEFLKE